MEKSIFGTFAFDIYCFEKRFTHVRDLCLMEKIKKTNSVMLPVIIQPSQDCGKLSSDIHYYN